MNNDTCTEQCENMKRRRRALNIREAESTLQTTAQKLQHVEIGEHRKDFQKVIK